MGELVVFVRIRAYLSEHHVRPKMVDQGGHYRLEGRKVDLVVHPARKGIFTLYPLPSPA